MELPKIIHYCWFGKSPLPKLAKKCIQSWKKYCPDYQIIEWNEDNFDVCCNKYVEDAYKNGKWAFVTDYVRLKAVYEYGGFYFDTDVEIIRPADEFLAELGDVQGFMGFEDDKFVATGLGFGAVKHHPLVKDLLDRYEEIPFVKPDGTLDLTSCPVRQTKFLLEAGLERKNEIQIINGMCILPSEYLCPKNYYSGKTKITKNTFSVHHYASSWISSVEKYELYLRRIFGKKIFHAYCRLKGLFQ